MAMNLAAVRKGMLIVKCVTVQIDLDITLLSLISRQMELELMFAKELHNIK